MSSALTRTKNDQSRFGLVLDQSRDMSAGFGLLRGRDGIFEIENERVRAAIACARELAFGIAGNEQERAQSHVEVGKALAAGGLALTPAATMSNRKRSTTFSSRGLSRAPLR